MKYNHSFFFKTYSAHRRRYYKFSILYDVYIYIRRSARTIIRMTKTFCENGIFYPLENKCAYTPFHNHQILTKIKY